MENSPEQTESIRRSFESYEDMIVTIIKNGHDQPFSKSHIIIPEKEEKLFKNLRRDSRERVFDFTCQYCGCRGVAVREDDEGRRVWKIEGERDLFDQKCNREES